MYTTVNHICAYSVEHVSYLHATNKPKYELSALVVSSVLYSSIHVRCTTKKKLQIHHGTHTGKGHCKYYLKSNSTLHCIIISFTHINTCLVRSRDQWIRYSDTQVSIITSFDYICSQEVQVVQGGLFIHSFMLHLWQENVCLALYTSPMAVVS